MPPKPLTARRAVSSMAYGLLVGLIAMVALAALDRSGSGVNRLFSTVSGNLAGVSSRPPAAPTPTPLPVPNAATCAPGTFVAAAFSGAGGCRFASTGSDQSWTVPTGTTQLQVRLWGAGGGGSWNGISASPVYTNGGGGGATAGTLAVTPAESLTLVVGGGGALGASGGGMSGVFRASTALMIAGGGGGAGETGNGGAGGGSSGANGTATSGSAGGGGSQSAGGTAVSGAGQSGTCGFETPPAGAFHAGRALEGGWGYGGACAAPSYGGGGRACDVYCNGGGGGGGGGWFGGGGGSGGLSNQSPGGGGGSGYCAATGCSTMAGSGATPADSTNPDRGTAGAGGVGLQVGQPGLLWLRW